MKTIFLSTLFISSLINISMGQNNFKGSANAEKRDSFISTIDSLVATIDDNYDPLHTDYTPSVHRLSEMGIPAIEAVLPLLDNTDEFIRMHAQRVVEGVINRMNGFVPGQGYTTKEGEEKVSFILNSIKYNYADTVLENRHRSIERLRNWLIGENKTGSISDDIIKPSLSTPQKSWQAFLAALKSGSDDEVKAVVTESAFNVYSMKMGVSGFSKMQTFVEEWSKYETRWEEIITDKNNSRSITLRLGPGNDEHVFIFIYTDDGWRMDSWNNHK